MSEDAVQIIREVTDLLVAKARIKELERALLGLADAADGVGVAHFDTDTMSPEVEAMQKATLEARAVLRGKQPSAAEEQS